MADVAEPHIESGEVERTPPAEEIVPEPGADDRGAPVPAAGPGQAREPGDVPTALSWFIEGPRLVPAGRSAPPHEILWLPPLPQTNSEEFDVYVECPVDPDEALADGVPSDQLFLFGHLGWDRLAARTTAGYLLHVRVQPGGAVDVGASDVEVPRVLVAPLRNPEVYLLPVAWLDRCRAVAVVPMAGPVEPEWRAFPEPRPLLVRCANADHGVEGLPAEPVGWPQGSLRATVTRFATIAEDDPAGPGTWLRLYRRRPEPVPGHRLVRLRVGCGKAIDVTATAAELAGLTSLRSTADSLVKAGVEVLLPAVSYPDTRVLRAYRCDGTGWRRMPVPRGQSLDRWLVDPPDRS